MKFIKITPREEQTAALLLEGKSNAAIASQLNITSGTIKVYMRDMCRRFGIEGGTGQRIRLAMYLLKRKQLAGGES